MMPVGLLVTVPAPVPVLVTVRVLLLRAKPAVTDLGAFIVTAQVPVPEQTPPQPVKVEPEAAFAVKVTAVFRA